MSDGDRHLDNSLTSPLLSKDEDLFDPRPSSISYPPLNHNNNINRLMNGTSRMEVELDINQNPPPTSSTLLKISEQQQQKQEQQHEDPPPTSSLLLGLTEQRQQQRNEQRTLSLPAPTTLVGKALRYEHLCMRSSTGNNRRGDRPCHLRDLINEQRKSILAMDKKVGYTSSSRTLIDSQDSSLQSTESEPATAVRGGGSQTHLAKRVMDVFHNSNFVPPAKQSIEVRMRDYSFVVPVKKSSGKIKTVWNQSIVFKGYKFIRNSIEAERSGRTNMCSGRDKGDVGYVLNNVNLVLQPGKLYLVLGPPGSGKTSLLRAIAGLLPNKKGKRGPSIDGSIEYNGLPYQNDKGIIFSNAISFIDQTDNHAPRLTVRETFKFAFSCKSGGTHRTAETPSTEKADGLIAELDKNEFRINMILEALGLSHVFDTFVGNSQVRGVSGGQRRRVSTGEMMMWGAPVMAGDEISTGLDATSTYEIVQSIKYFTRIMKLTRVLSLLQPSPETYALFDEVIVLSEGYVIFAGPIDAVEYYFNTLGYIIPDQMDVADFLQTISTPYGKELFVKSKERETPLTAKEMGEAFRTSQFSDVIKENLASSWRNNWRDVQLSNSEKDDTDDQLQSAEKGDQVLVVQTPFVKRYQNNLLKSMWLNFVRFFTIWRRDKRFVIANAIKNLVMGLSVGAVFFQTTSIVSIFGVLFQGMLFIMLGSMTTAPNQIDDRAIYYKHHDANFYPTSAFVTGRTLSLIPQSIMDCIMFGTMIYWMVGLVTSVSAFFTFLAILVVFTLVMNTMLGIFATISPTRATVQAISAFILLLHVLFCGFIVSPNIIPNYYIWLYWWNPLAWAYRALLVNEFRSEKYNYYLSDLPTQFGNATYGEIILHSKGFYYNGGTYGQEWVGYSFAYLIPFIIFCLFVSTLCLKYVRVEKASGDGVKAVKSLKQENTLNEEEEESHGEEMSTEIDNFKQNGTRRKSINLPFVPVDLSFEKICYTVKASTSGEQLKLLNEVSGVLQSRRMCALMGSSGAGKTTLMDVIALRKTSGTITGEVRLNGHPQEPQSFRRCSGYVEQFDVQSPELTVRETITFSANMRLSASNFASQEDIDKFVGDIIAVLELEPEEHMLVGTMETGGLSFEQKKRLSIAVELAASPSVLFLDEPTSGLDSRAALVVMRSLRRICDTGRTICATIHQPSLAVFEMFDDLLLLKKGGEAVYFGELGIGSDKLIDYFESRGAKPINHGENPGTWMLNVIGAPVSKGSVTSSMSKSPDYALMYTQSKEYATTHALITDLKNNIDESRKIAYDSEFPTTFTRRNMLVNDRLVLIYWRSPTYNLSRLMLSLGIAFILGSVFIRYDRPETFEEMQLSSAISTIFISFIIIGVLSITSVLPVMLSIRDMFYRHRAAGMLNHTSLAMALGVAEKRFILLSSMLFTIVFYFTMGLEPSARKFFAFWGFFTFNLAIYSYFGQAFMCLVRGMATAQILCSVFIGINNFFSGLIVRPQYLTGFWQVTYWITPGHYVFEGLVVTQFSDDERLVEAYFGSEFFQYMNCTLLQNTSDDGSRQCVGYVRQYVDSFFGGRFTRDHVPQDLVILGLYLTFARVLTYFALKKFNYASN